MVTYIKLRNQTRQLLEIYYKDRTYVSHVLNVNGNYIIFTERRYFTTNAWFSHCCNLNSGGMREVFQGVRGELAETKVVGPTIMLPLCVAHEGEHLFM